MKFSTPSYFYTNGVMQNVMVILFTKHILSSTIYNREWGNKIRERCTISSLTPTHRRPNCRKVNVSALELAAELVGRVENVGNEVQERDKLELGQLHVESNGRRVACRRILFDEQHQRFVIPN